MLIFVLSISFRELDEHSLPIRIILNSVVVEVFCVGPLPFWSGISSSLALPGSGGVGGLRLLLRLPMLEKLTNNVLIDSCPLALLRCLALLVLIIDPFGRDQTRLVALTELGELLIEP